MLDDTCYGDEEEGDEDEPEHEGLVGPQPMPPYIRCMFLIKNKPIII